MVTDVQGSCYELVADDCNNMYTIFRQISDIKNIQTLSTLPKVSPPPSPDTNIVPKTIPLPTQLLMTLLAHTLPNLVRIIPLTTKPQLPLYQDHPIPTHNKRERERERWI